MNFEKPGELIETAPDKAQQETDQNLAEVESLVESSGELPPEKKQKSAKQQKIDELTQEVEKTCDLLGCEIDEKIKETVVYLKAHGFVTSQSCQGHLDYGHPFPWVNVNIDKNFLPIEDPDYDNMDIMYNDQAEVIEEVLKKNNISYQDLSQEKYSDILAEALKTLKEKGETPEFKNYKEEMAKLKDQVETLINEYNQKKLINPEAKIKAYDEIKGLIQIYSGDREDELINERSEEISPAKRKDLKDKLVKYQAEMANFTQFLKEKYFDEEAAE